MIKVIDQAAVGYLNWLGEVIHNCALPATNRVRAAAGCLAIAREHHRAIVVLLDHDRFASAFALVRVAFEAYVRGEWLALCATDQQVDEFVHGEEPPCLRVLLEQLELTSGFKQQVLSKMKAQAWKAMCAYTHTGGLQVQRWNTPEGIEPNYEEDELKEVLSFAETIGSLATIGVAGLAGDVKVSETLLARFKERKGA